MELLEVIFASGRSDDGHFVGWFYIFKLCVVSSKILGGLIGSDEFSSR